MLKLILITLPNNSSQTSFLKDLRVYIAFFLNSQYPYFCKSAVAILNLFAGLCYLAHVGMTGESCLPQNFQSSPAGYNPLACQHMEAVG